MVERLEFSIEYIENGLDTLGLSSLNYEFVEEQLAEYKETNTLSAWKDENFRKLSRRITDILGVRMRVENSVVTAIDNDELTDMLNRIVSQVIDAPTEQITIALSQCLMKDMSIQQNELEVREKIYLNWIQSVTGRSFKG